MKDKSDIWLYIFTGVITITLIVIIWTHAIYLSSDNFAQAIWSEMRLLGAAIENWQPLIGAIIAAIMALIAAWWTVRGIRSQIEESKDARKDDIRRKYLSSLALMPAALAELDQYCTNYIAWLVPAYSRSTNTTAIAQSKALPNPPIEVTKRIAEVIGSCPPNVIEAPNTLATLLSALQIHHSRHGETGQSSTRSNNIVRAIRDSIELKMLVGACYPFARGEVDELGLVDLDRKMKGIQSVTDILDRAMRRNQPVVSVPVNLTNQLKREKYGLLASVRNKTQPEGGLMRVGDPLGFEGYEVK